MDVKKLYEKAQLAVINGCIVISEDRGSTFSVVCNEITEIFDAVNSSVTSFGVNGAVLFYDEGKNIFSITTSSQCEVYEGFTFQSISFSASALVLTCKIQERRFDPEGRFLLSDCRNSFEIAYGSGHVIDKIEGSMGFGSVSLALAGVLDAGGREFYLKESSGIEGKALLASSFEVFSIPSFISPDLPITIKSIQAVFAESTSEEGIVPNDSFALEIEAGCVFRIGKHFEISSLKFYFEKFGCEYSLGIEGKVKLLTFPEVDFFARYDNEGVYTFGLCEDGNTQFGFGRIAELTGVAAEGDFPAELASSEGLTLSNLTVATDFKQILSFLLEIDYRDKWIFCQKPQLGLSDLKLHLYISDSVKNYGITGCVTLLGKDVSVSAEYSSGGGWIFKGAIDPCDTVSMKELAQGLAQLFGASGFTVPFDVKAVDLKVSAGLTGDFVFSGMIFAGDSEDKNIAKLFNGNCNFYVKNEIKDGKSDLKVKIDGFARICGHRFEILYENDEKNLLSASFTARDKDGLSLKALLELFGDEVLAESLPECFDLSLLKVAVAYETGGQKGKILSIRADLNTFEVDAEFVFHEKTDYTVKIKINGKIELADIPVAGDVLKALGSNTSVSGFVLNFSKKAGLVFDCNVWGENYSCVLIPPAARAEDGMLLAGKGKAHEEENPLYAGNADTHAVKWIEVNKKISIFQLHKIGIELKGNQIGLLVDASLDFSPLQVDFMGVGISAGLPEFKTVHFIMEGFGVSFHNDTISVSGAFRHCDGSYAGEIEVAMGKFSLVLAGQYRKNSLMAYAVLNCPLGGPPCFSVTGLSAAFGYNKMLRLPDLAEVSRYPLIHAAMGKCDKTKLISDLSNYAIDEGGENFLAAGIKFTSFQIVNGFAMATVSFGRETEIGLLGLADIVMPPACDKTPVAKAQLALKAAVLLKDGLFSCQARLTENSYILSEKCKLTGGFACCLWFGGMHKGDFVVTLGGYHPSYRKPAHYPDVPRLGFCWDVLPEKNRLVLSGEIYFALTPSAIMAGGKLSAVYSKGNLKAYFIAYADFLIAWKPFSYDIAIGIMLGASYRVDVWFVHRTFTIELSADLHIWGPEFSGKAHISWYIISFTVPFGSAKKEEAPPIDWKTFRESFLQDTPAGKENGRGKGVEPGSALSVRVMGETAENVVRADDFRMVVETKIPGKRAVVFGKKLDLYKDDIGIQPMGGKLTDSELSVMLVKWEDGKTKESAFDTVVSVTYGNVPSALWGEKGSGKELVCDVPVGVTAVPESYVPSLFPADGDISEEAVTQAQKLVMKDAFASVKGPETQEYMHQDTVAEFIKSAARVSGAGTEFLRSLGFEGNVTLEQFCKNADNLFDDDILIGSVAG